MNDSTAMLAELIKIRQLLEQQVLHLTEIKTHVKYLDDKKKYDW